MKAKTLLLGVLGLVVTEAQAQKLAANHHAHGNAAAAKAAKLAQKRADDSLKNEVSMAKQRYVEMEWLNKHQQGVNETPKQAWVIINKFYEHSIAKEMKENDESKKEAVGKFIKKSKEVNLYTMRQIFKNQCDEKKIVVDMPDFSKDLTAHK